MRKIILFSLIVAFLSCLQLNPVAAAGDQPVAEEYAIYGTLLDHLYGGGETKLLVIESKTDSYSVREGGLDQHIAFITRGLPDIRDEVITDFFSKNHKRCPLGNQFELKVQSELVAKQEIDRILGRDPYRGWEK